MRIILVNGFDVSAFTGYLRQRFKPSAKKWDAKAPSRVFAALSRMLQHPEMVKRYPLKFDNQKLGLIKLFIIRMKKKNAKAAKLAKPPSKCIF